MDVYLITLSMPVFESLAPGGSVSAMQLLQVVPLQGSGNFLELAIVFFILALVAAVLGASGIAGISMTIAKWFVIIFIVLAIISAVL